MAASARLRAGGGCDSIDAVNRRQFLRNAAVVAVAGPALAADAKYVPPVLTPPLVGSQLYGWGQYYQRAGKNLDEHLDEVLSALRDAGYDYAEGSLDTANPENNAKFAERLKKKGLKPVSLYTGGAMRPRGGEPDRGTDRRRRQGSGKGWLRYRQLQPRSDWPEQDGRRIGDPGRGPAGTGR